MSEIKPAMTAEEWAEGRVHFPPPEGWSDWIEGGYYLRGDDVVYALEVEGCDRDTPLDRRHAAAALCLHGQPFGFTWEDVDNLRGFHEFIGYDVDTWGLLRIADRIEALLPPREP